MDISISQSRVQQVTQTVQTFVGNFNKKIGPELTTNQFTAPLHPQIQWRDHAFHIQREGPEAILGLHRSFLFCNSPFRVEIKAILPTSEGAVIEKVWVGRCVNDIVRPDGTVAVKATGKDFECHVCMVFKINTDGLIEQIDEYYNKQWDDGVRESNYVVMRGASLKEKE